jgi:SOS-response transcriptional repressor LexA
VESAYPDGAFWLPGDLVKRESVVIISAVGDSMVDAGIEDGDQLHLQLDAAIRDGDQVVACINGESILKSYFRDSDGTVWLVACNENYDAIEVTEDMEVRILGQGGEVCEDHALVQLPIPAACRKPHQDEAH